MAAGEGFQAQGWASSSRRRWPLTQPFTLAVRLFATMLEAQTLVDLGVDHGQGWHVGRPGPPEALAPVPAAAISV